MGLTPEEWKALPGIEKNRLRAIKNQRRREEKAAREHDAKERAALTMSERPLPSWQTLPLRTFFSKNLEPLEMNDAYLGAACFITLTGPSIKEHDLSLLKQRGLFTIGVNNSPALVKPDFWTYVDRSYRFHDAIWRDPTITKCIPVQHLEKWQLKRWDEGEGKPVPWAKPNGDAVKPRDCPGVISHRRNAYFCDRNWLSEPSLNWGNSEKSHKANGWPHKLDTMFLAINSAYALGFRRVFLLGCDFTMRPTEPYGIDEGKEAGAVTACNLGYHKMDLMFQALQKSLFTTAGFHVYNCAEVSGLTAFPFCPYDEALDAATEGMPSDPLKTRGWYQL